MEKFETGDYNTIRVQREIKIQRDTNNDYNTIPTKKQWGRAVVDQKANLTVVAAQESPTTKGGGVVDGRAVDKRGGWVCEEIGGRNVGK
ncbi:hypothetical protein L484_010643 [Morus notabilis]|uniref:Uncharacterized protein n=1 Tax=Morus notabilis TaxID=981085 RepID=W9S377_9ROSA|nr:hypothetical protein L484_010643 [Morus notabilis]